MVEYSVFRMQWLCSQLAEGWRLEGPAIERASANARTSTFEFMLRGERGCQLLAINDCPEVRRFMQERRIDCVLI